MVSVGLIPLASTIEDMKELEKAIKTCNDIQAVKNIATILLEEGITYLDNGTKLEAVKQAYSELVDTHYTEELAAIYYDSKQLDSNIMDSATDSYTEEIEATYKNVNVWDWLVLYGRMSLNTKGDEAIIKACRMFLDNGFSVWEMV